MPDLTDGLPVLREQVLRIAVAARSARSRAGDLDEAWVHDLDELIRQADICRQTIDGQPRTAQEVARSRPRSTAVGPALARAIDDLAQRRLCRPDSVRRSVLGDPHVVLNAEILDQICTGLVLDACEHARPGTSIGITARSDVVEVHIQVTHDGRGADRDRLDVLLCEPRGYDGADWAAGTALNLRLVRALVEAHGGYLEVEDRGTRFAVTVCLPAPTPSSRAGSTVIDLRDPGQGHQAP